jgi:hypothetical protein
MSLKSILTVVLLLILSINLFAGTIIKIKTVHTIFGEKMESEEITFIQDGKLRIESNDVEDNSITIIDTKTNTIINVDLDDSSYVVITEKDFAKLSQIIKAKMDEMLKQFPKEEQDAMREMLESQMEQMKNQPKTEYKKVRNENFNGYDCEVYEGFEMEKKVEETWIAPWKNIETMNEYLEIFKNLESFFKKIADNLGEFSDAIGNEFDFDMLQKGFPVKTIEYDDGELSTVETLEEVIHKELSPSLFEVPTGMKKKGFAEDL